MRPALRLAVALVLASPAAHAAGPALRVTQAKLDANRPGGDRRGKALVKAAVDDSANGGSLEAALAGGGVTIGIRDAAAFAVDATFPSCQSTAGALRCTSAGGRLVLARTPTAFAYRLVLSLGDLSSAVTGATRPVGPVRVTIRRAAVPDLVGTIVDCAASGPTRLRCRDRRRPNIVVVMTDDQRWDTLAYMPRVMDQLADRGVTFGNAFVTTPLCAPSRASTLTGQYARHHGVLTLAAPSGGATKFVGRDVSTIATWLHDAGYRTGLYGKYINEYEAQCPPATASCYIPPGWDEWHAFVRQHYYDYTLVENGALTTFGSTPADYSTDVLGAKAADFVATAAGQPFFLYVAFHAPHQEDAYAPVPAPRHAHMYDGIPLWRPPSWDEADVGDKPPWYAELPRADAPLGFYTQGSWGDWVRQEQLETLAAVDEAVDAILRAVDATGEADDTIVVFTSDNGFMWGEHREFIGKVVPQEESIRVPLIVRYPRLTTTPHVETHVALNIDLAPTLARLAGLAPPSPVDGVSLAPLLQSAVASWRDGFVIESWRSSWSPEPSYVGLRTPRWKYVSYPDVGETELYDLMQDPFELDSRAHDPTAAPIATGLKAELDDLLAR